MSFLTISSAVADVVAAGADTIFLLAAWLRPAASTTDHGHASESQNQFTCYIDAWEGLSGKKTFIVEVELLLSTWYAKRSLDRAGHVPNRLLTLSLQSQELTRGIDDMNSLHTVPQCLSIVLASRELWKTA